MNQKTEHEQKTEHRAKKAEEKGEVGGQGMRLLRGDVFNILILCQYVQTFRNVDHEIG